ncbi:tyrosine-type recombinase/integrase [Streptococcus gallinaceus]|uniref:tyrosine-type recombinase/integrase n=1 Tax=Streptococcus gallinaceus TaxID=165758 RepID=UPI00209E4889
MYLFTSRTGTNKPLHRRTVYWFLSKAGKAIGLSNIGTQTMRKTFGYHYYKKYGNVADLMAIFNHSSPEITLRYIMETQDYLIEI